MKNENAFSRFIDNIFEPVEINGIVIDASEVLQSTRPHYYQSLLEHWFNSMAEFEHECECACEAQAKKPRKKKKGAK